MGKKAPAATTPHATTPYAPRLLATARVIYCGDCLEQLEKLPAQCVDLIYSDAPELIARYRENFERHLKHSKPYERD